VLGRASLAAEAERLCGLLRHDRILLFFAAGVNAMIIVVEIVSRTGTRACKEYDAPSYNAAIEAVKRELRIYPTFRVTDIRIKDEPAMQHESADEW
jgi:hypothetical protein